MGQRACVTYKFNHLMVHTMLDEFRKMLDLEAPTGRQKEQYVQDYMEKNTEFLPTPGLENHRLHMTSVISKFPIDISLICDYAYITKSSIKWKVYFVELEKPEKKIFKESKGQIGFTSEFNDAISQIRSWKIFARSSAASIKKRLLPLLQPISMRENEIEYCYALVYGRNSEYVNSNAKRATLSEFMDSEGIKFYTYDSIASEVEASPAGKKNIMQLSKNGYSFKYLHTEPSNLFSYVGPDEFTLSEEQAVQLKTWGYQIEQWKNGKLLTLNTKFVAESPEAIAKDVLDAISRRL
jgi:hypothetical protein